MWINPPIELKTLPREPGVYRMLDAARKVLYIGKARNLRKRVSSYFHKIPDSPRTRAMLQQVRDIETTITASEAEALIVEHNLIKQLKPRYNVLLKDAKSYPYILLTDEAYPRLRMYRGRCDVPGEYFGPFPHAGAVQQTLQLMQKVFRIRDCEESTFRNRSRPCMQYQIGRCTAPCCQRVDDAAYHRQVRQARAFLQGHDQEYLQQWQQEMEQAAAALNFEHAARLRDRIRMMRSILAGQQKSGLPDDADAIVILQRGESVHLCIGSRRAGRDLGSHCLRVDQAADASHLEILQSLFMERYQRDTPPAEIMIEHNCSEELSGLLRLLCPQQKVSIQMPQRGKKHEWLAQVRHSGEQYLASRSQAQQQPAFEALAELLALPEAPRRIAAVDNAHLGGQQMVSAIVFAGWQGPEKEYYRRYKLEDGGDDYAGMREVLTRFFRNIREEKLPLPDILFIDGGKGQLEVAMAAAAECGMDALKMVAVAKGRQRKVGTEVLWPSWREQTLRPGRHSPALMLIARVRDEAHRFAGEHMRKRKKKQMLSSSLEQIDGVGPARRMALLRHFGGIEGVRQASREQLMEVPGISAIFADRIFTRLHNQ